MKHFRFGGEFLAFEVAEDSVPGTNEAKFLWVPVLALCFVDLVDGGGFGELFSEEFGARSAAVATGSPAAAMMVVAAFIWQMVRSPDLAQ